MSSVGQQLLSNYISALSTNPLRTKMLTSGVLAALAEVLAGKFAGVAPASKKLTPEEKKRQQGDPIQAVLSAFEAVGINERALKMFVYGFAISAPLGHVMTGGYSFYRAGLF